MKNFFKSPPSGSSLLMSIGCLLMFIGARWFGEPHAPLYLIAMALFWIDNSIGDLK